MATEDGDAKHVCDDCIGDPFLAEEVRAEGHRATCTYCGELRGALTLDDLSERIHSVLQDHFELTPSQPSAFEYGMIEDGHWERLGYLVADVIADMAGVSQEIAEDVRALLSEHYGYRAMKDGEDDPYGGDACYEERGPDDSGFRDSWAAFRSEICSRARFFSPYAEESLSSIFGDLISHRTSDGRSVIRETKPDDEDRYVWRARMARSTKELKAILKSPAREIGPPPSRLAKGGRMNAHGIPVFYGAKDEQTSVAEVRAPVGSHVVVAKFELLRLVRLLDFDALKEIYVRGSHFDPEYPTREGRAAFLRRLVREISRPVMPRDEAFEYLATQAVAEYLANKVEPQLDGIIFRSSQTGNTGCNLVLFNHACGVVPDNPPDGTEVNVYIYHTDDDEDEGGGDGDITVFETERPEPPVDSSQTAPRDPIEDMLETLRDFPFSGGYEDNEDNDDHDELPTYAEPTLRLDEKSIVVLDITGVEYKCRHREVRYRRRAKDEKQAS